MWILVVLAILLFLYTLRESFTDTEFTNVTRPSLDDSSWKSKIDAQVPIGSNDADYIKALQAFYDKVYKPAELKPTTADIETFLKGPDVNGVPVDSGALRMIISAAFHIQPSMSAAAREEKQVKFQPSAALEPSNGRDEVYNREEETYRPSDTRIGELPEGKYAPVEQQFTPRHSGEPDYKTISWNQSLFYDVCTDSKKPGCEENVL
jgi:hypothetical protein